MENQTSKVAEAVARKASGRYNCAQAVACTYCEGTGLDEETLRDVAHAFGTGMGCMEGTCGALVGAGVVLSLRRRNRAAAMKGMRVLMERFAQRNGATLCRELKGIGTGCPLRECNDCVADAAGMLEELIAAEETPAGR